MYVDWTDNVELTNIEFRGQTSKFRQIIAEWDTEKMCPSSERITEL